ncbi:alanine--tRNA ligase [Buchnera aphidicola (Mollitrichosiphum nigrofasciatum)]|uniref:alanine--tRNA ligase n=1 Tax=Buchnera aphidicola TaxID=9 RepID=UPI0031B84B06
MYKKTQEIKNMFLNFFHNNKHKIIKSSSLIPKNDESILFTNAGMNQFKDIFLGKKIPKYPNVTSVQNCLRTGGKHDDLEKVGYTKKHHTFFEMLGNFSFGSYFKKKAITLAWELLTSKLWYNLDKNRIWITTYYKDYESYNIWTQIIGISKKKIVRIADKKKKLYSSDNFWQMGNTGLCGPCTEIYYYYGKNEYKDNIYNITKHKKFIEIWNIVFMEFNKNKNNILKKLPYISIDTGMGLERLTSVIQKVYSNYKIDNFISIKKIISKIIKIPLKKENENSINVISDHIRSIIMIISENIVPSNEKQGYILRKIIRRAIRFGYKIKKKKPFLYKLISTVYEYIFKNRKLNFKKIQYITKIVHKEEKKFHKTLENGLKIAHYEIKNANNKILKGDVIFYLYDTFGFPVEFTKEICTEKNITFDYQGFLEKQKKNKKNIFKKQKNTKFTKIQIQCKKTKFLGYEKFHINNSKIIKIIVNDITVNNIQKNQKGIIILNKTPFYSESGGQIGDTGILYTNKSIFLIHNTQKKNDLTLHIGKTIHGSFNINDIIFATINYKKRKKIQNNHTSAHLLQKALNIILKKKISQKGSFINDKYIRFDFNHNKPISLNKIHKIEQLINKIITENIKIKTKLIEFKKAKKLGAVSLNKYNYNKTVRVIIINSFSIELCKGTHVKRTGQIGTFKIKSEKNISTGIRRIEAKTNNKAILLTHKKEINLQYIFKLLNTNKNDIIGKIKKLKENLDKYVKKNKKLEQKNIQYKIQFFEKKTIQIKNVKLLISEVKYKNYKLLRYIIDLLKKKLSPNAIIILQNSNKNKNTVIVGITASLNNIITAKEIIKKIICNNNGKGGGNKELAEGNITNQKKITKIFKNIKKWIISLINEHHSYINY